MRSARAADAAADNDIIGIVGQMLAAAQVRDLVWRLLPVCLGRMGNREADGEAGALVHPGVW